MKLSEDILDPYDCDAKKYGILSVIITYYTHLIAAGGSKVLLFFVLEYNMLVDTIIGLPFIKTRKLELRLDPDLFPSYALTKCQSCIHRLN